MIQRLQINLIPSLRILFYNMTWNRRKLLRSSRSGIFQIFGQIIRSNQKLWIILYFFSNLMKGLHPLQALFAVNFRHDSEGRIIFLGVVLDEKTFVFAGSETINRRLLKKPHSARFKSWFWFCLFCLILFNLFLQILL